jgi:hypothetical protein
MELEELEVTPNLRPRLFIEEVVNDAEIGVVEGRGHDHHRTSVVARSASTQSMHLVLAVRCRNWPRPP